MNCKNLVEHSYASKASIVKISYIKLVKQLVQELLWTDANEYNLKSKKCTAIRQV